MPPSENPQTQAGDQAGQRGGAILTHHPPCRSPAHTPWGAQPLFHSTEGLRGGVKSPARGGAGDAVPNCIPYMWQGLEEGGAGDPQHRPGCFWQPDSAGFIYVFLPLCAGKAVGAGASSGGSEYCFVMMPANSSLVRKGTEPAVEVERGERHPPTHSPTHARPSRHPTIGYRYGGRHSRGAGAGR